MKKTEQIFLYGLIVLLFILEFLQITKNKELQTQIDKLRIIVDQKSLPCLILDPLMIR